MYLWISRTLDFGFEFCEKKSGLYMDVYGKFQKFSAGGGPRTLLQACTLLARGRLPAYSKQTHLQL